MVAPVHNILDVPLYVILSCTYHPCDVMEGQEALLVDRGYEFGAQSHPCAEMEDQEAHPVERGQDFGAHSNPCAEMEGQEALVVVESRQVFEA
jgi:hypothetical protein